MEVPRRSVEEGVDNGRETEGEVDVASDRKAGRIGIWKRSLEKVERCNKIMQSKGTQMQKEGRFAGWSQR